MTEPSPRVRRRWVGGVVWVKVHSTQISESALLVQGGNGVARQGSGGEEVLLLLLKHVCNSLSMPNREDKLRNVRTVCLESGGVGGLGGWGWLDGYGDEGVVLVCVGGLC